MKKVVLVVLAVMFILVGLYLTKEEFNEDYNAQFDALEASPNWHYSFTSSQGNAVFWNTDGTQYFVVEVFGDHSEEFSELSL